MFSRLLLVCAVALAVGAAPAYAAGPNLLRNASWELPSFQHWDFFLGGPSQAGTLTTPGVAREGTGYGVIETATSGNSFAQDVLAAASPNRSYTFSLWMRSANGSPFKGTLALFGIGSVIEGASTDFTVGGAWTLVSVSLNVAQPGHSSLRAQVYLGTTKAQLLLDGAQLLDVGLTNSSWERGFAGWIFPNGAITTSTSAVRSLARDGGSFGVVRTPPGRRSLAQDLAVAAAPGQSHTFSVWLRSASEQTVSGLVTLWALGGVNESSNTPFTVGPAWTLVSATMSPVNGGHTVLRPEVYIDTPGVDLFLDGAQVVDAGFANAGFEHSFFRGWDAFPRGALAAAGSGAGSAREGKGVASIRTGAAGRSFAQDAPVSLAAGQSATFSAWLRSPSGRSVSGSLVLRALGGQEEASSTPFTVGSRWTLISVPMNPARAHTSLRAEVVLNTPGVELNVDAASFAAGNARDNAPVPPVPPAAPPPGPGPAPKPLGYVRSAISYKWSVKPTYTRATRLIVRDVPEAGRVEFRCTGRGCPTKRTVTRRRIKTTSFLTLLNRSKLRPGVRVEVRVLAPDMIGKVARFQIRRKKLPKVTFLCLRPGAKAPAKCT